MSIKITNINRNIETCHKTRTMCVMILKSVGRIAHNFFTPRTSVGGRRKKCINIDTIRLKCDPYIMSKMGGKLLVQHARTRMQN